MHEMYQFRIAGVSYLDLLGVLRSTKETCPSIYQQLKVSVVFQRQAVHHYGNMLTENSLF